MPGESHVPTIEHAKPPPAPSGTNPSNSPPIVPGAVLLDSLARNKDAVKEVISAFGEQVSHARTAKLRISQQTSWLVFSFLGLIVLATGALVYAEKMSDGSLTFLLGVIIGYLMHFADKILFQPEGDQ